VTIVGIPVAIAAEAAAAVAAVGAIANAAAGIYNMATGDSSGRGAGTSAGASERYPRDYATKDTINRSAKYGSEREARALARTKLGSDPIQVDPGKLRSQDGRWQYRGKPEDLAGHGSGDGPHIHLERLDPETGEVLENWHLRW
jgi:hypothetical protein